MPVEPDEILDYLYKSLGIDDEWAVREPGSFTWWPYRIRQTVRAYPPVLDHGEMITRVIAEVPLLRDVPPDRAPFFVAIANMMSVGTGIVYDPAERTIRKRLTASVWEGNRGWLQNEVLQALALQEAMVQGEMLDGLAETFGGAPDLEPHPVSGERPEPDDMTNVGGLYVAAGQSTVITSGELAELPALMRPMPLRAHGCEVRAKVPGPLPGQWSLGSTQHPELGWGLICLTQFALGIAMEEAVALASDLSRADSDLARSSHSFGGWAATPDGSVAHHWFLPEMMYARHPRHGRLARMQNLAFDGFGRGGWAGEWIDSWMRRRRVN